MNQECYYLALLSRVEENVFRAQMDFCQKGFLLRFTSDMIFELSTSEMQGEAQPVVGAGFEPVAWQPTGSASSAGEGEGGLGRQLPPRRKLPTL